MSLGTTEQCERCEESFPEHLIHPLVFICKDCRGVNIMMVCPPCALECKRRMHDDPTYMFDGEKARELYYEALEYLERRSCNANTETEKE